MKGRVHYRIPHWNSQQTWKAGRAGAISHISEQGTRDRKRLTKRQSQSRDQVPSLLALSQGFVPPTLRIISILINTCQLIKIWRQGPDMKCYSLNYQPEFKSSYLIQEITGNHHFNMYGLTKLVLKLSPDGFWKHFPFWCSQSWKVGSSPENFMYSEDARVSDSNGCCQ